MSKKKITSTKVNFSNTSTIDSSVNRVSLSKTQLVGIALLTLFTFVLFATGFNHQFVEWDDQLYVRDNPLVNNPTWSNFFKTFRTSVALNYHPFTVISLWINAKFSGIESAKSFIVTNVLIHVLNVLLVFGFAYKLSKKQFWTAFVTAVLFAVHPMKVESVIWVSERKDVLYACFFLFSILSYLRFLETNSKKHNALCFLFFLCSCLSKGQAVVLPVVLLLIDYYQSNLSTKKIVSKLPFFIVSILFGLIALDIQAGGNFYGLTTLNPNQKTALDLSVFSMSNRVIYAGYSFMWYILNFVFPHNLGPFNPYLDFSTPEGTRYYLGIPFVMITFALTYFSLKKSKLFVFGIGFYLITIALLLQFISVGTTIVSERYSYLPYFGLAFIVGTLMNAMFNNPKVVISILAKVLCGTLIVAWTFQTTKQIKIWDNSLSLFSRMIENYPNDYRPYSTRGKMIGMAGDLDGGIKDLEKSVALGAKESAVFADLGTAYAMKGQIDKAVVNFTKSINLGDTSGESYLNRGIAIMNTDPDGSLLDFDKALTLMPNREIDILVNKTIIYKNQGKSDLAMNNINRAINLGNSNARLFQIRGNLFEEAGKAQAAILDYEQTLRLDSTNEQVKQRLQLLKN